MYRYFLKRKAVEINRMRRRELSDNMLLPPGTK
jgi:hypothetical protein